MEGELDHAKEGDIIDLKMKKTKQKTRFTRALNKLKNCIHDETLSTKDIKAMGPPLLDKLEEEMDDAIDSLNNLCLEFKAQEKTKEMKSTMTEIETIENNYEQTVKEYNAIVKRKDVTEESEAVETEEVEVIEVIKDKKAKQLNKDINSQLKKVQIPVFAGNKKDYPFWRTAFTECIDNTNMSEEYKFLQLRQYVKGEALEAIEGLGYSKLAYEKAKERLDRKYGGSRRLVNKFLDEISSFPTIKYENSKLVEKFADLLDIAIINIKENEINDMKSGFMYQQLLKKLPESMIIKYQRHLFENSLHESVEELSKWVNRESEFMTLAHEARHGIEEKTEPQTSRRPDSKHHRADRSQRTFFQGANPSRKKRCCGYCNMEGHDTYQCTAFKSLNVEKRWEEAKHRDMCFRCLRTNHKGSNCFNFRVCNIHGCKKTHDRLLHMLDDSQGQQDKHEDGATGGINSDSNFAKEESGYLSSEKGYVALRTVPVILTSENRRITVNALLDDGSTRTYLNASVAGELGLSEKIEKVKINTLNGQTETFETMPVKVGLESTNGLIKMNVEANTINNVTGSLQTIDWNRRKVDFDHLWGIEFPTVNKKTKIDLLIGVDYIDLHQSLHEIRGKTGEPVARLTPLGWTCVGVTNNNQHYSHHTYFLNSEDQLNLTMKRFWEVENIESLRSEMSIEQKKAVEIAENTIQEINNRYEIGIPWKKPPRMESNREMAINRLKSTQRKLEKDLKVKSVYEQTIQQYEEKGYISKVKSEDESQSIYHISQL